MTLAARTRDTIRDRPFMLLALRAGVLNHAAAARALDIDGQTEAIATAIRRFGQTLEPADAADRSVTVRLRRGVGWGTDDGSESLLSVGGVAIGGRGDYTALLATGEVSPELLAVGIQRLAATERPAVAAGSGQETLVLLVPEGHGPDALRTLEATVETTPEPVIPGSG
ncbi:MAG: hypothetical protein ABEJ35_07535 [Halobacteriaceae archaeon]